MTVPFRPIDFGLIGGGAIGGAITGVCAAIGAIPIRERYAKPATAAEAMRRVAQAWAGLRRAGTPPFSPSSLRTVM